MLGPVRVVADENEGDRLRGAAVRRRERLLLGLLALEVGRPVGVERLTSRLWDGEPPQSPKQPLQVAVSRLRSVLTAGGMDVERRGDSYLLAAEPERVDAHRFLAEVAAARTESQPRRRGDLLRAALDRWQGPLLADAADDLLRSRLGGRLMEARQAAVESRVEADLEAGGTDALLPELAALTETHPFRERLVVARMRALHCVGRTVEALDVYQTYRTRLRDELGLDPGREVAAAHRAVLNRAPAAAIRTSSGPAPRQLPADVGGFTGREAELAALNGLLDDSGRRGAATISAITGAAGVGKTTLAVHWGHRASAWFPDGQLYVNLRGFDPGRATDPADAIRGFLSAFGVSKERIPDDLDAQAALYRSLLAERRVLIVLDNARDAAQTRPLLPGGRGNLVVVTSRNRLTGLVTARAAHPIRLDVLAGDEARRLLRRRIGEARVDREPAAADEIVARCARLPLPLAVAAAWAAEHPESPLSELADGLRAGLDAFEAEDEATSVRAAFSWSYRTLDAESARVFRLLGLHPGSELTVEATASLTALPPERTRECLDGLAAAHLATERSPGRYAQHDLLREYARELADRHGDDADSRAALCRIFDHYLHSAYAAEQRFNQARELFSLPPPAENTVVLRPADHREALAFFAREHVNLRSVVDGAAATGFADHAWRLACVLCTFLNNQALHREWESVMNTALTAALRLEAPEAEARVRLDFSMM
ncbi:MAG: BTAD domain-containing putative transcriptional regulator, partial [Stackebrandtia sp.]